MDTDTDSDTDVVYDTDLVNQLKSLQLMLQQKLKKFEPDSPTPTKKARLDNVSIKCSFSLKVAIGLLLILSHSEKIHTIEIRKKKNFLNCC